MRIAILGAGRVGTTLGRRWSDVGHSIVYGVRDPHAERHATLPERAEPTSAVDGADAIVVALPWDATHDVVSGLGVGDAVVIDATNPLAANARELKGHPDLSGAELIAKWIPSTKVVKAFNTTGAANMAAPTYPSGQAAMLVAGDDADAKILTLGLADEIGFDAIDAGPLSAAADLEHLAMVWIRLAYPLGNGPDIALSVMRR